MFTKLLIANRGEIACRIIKTAQRLNITTIAIYSEADKNALHVQMADEAYCVGPASSAQSYLNIAKIIEVAKQTGTQAIHPGYGFLAENAEFAQACVEANIIFIGPSAPAIRAMGNKSAAKLLVIQHKLPTIPGYSETAQDLPTLEKAAQKIGLPLLIKAVSGGGGRGMRLVEDFAQLEESIQAAKREAKTSFKDDTILLEKYFPMARHVEVQLLRDQHGNGVYLFDRDCSVQRRHQKIIEEAPAPNLKAETRRKMGETALKIAEIINYTNAGTIEFLVDPQENFYFMEMNTRLQVEHPVTEMITGLDLVEWQLRIAANEKLAFQQNQLQVNGHAIEARICAENPLHEFAPSSGLLKLCEFPAQDAQHRVDTGVRSGDSISPFYDSMIAKIIGAGQTREQAIQNLQTSLAHTFIVGVDNNICLLQHILSHSDFIQFNIYTQWLTQKQSALIILLNQSPTFEIKCMAALAEQHRQQAHAQALAAASTDAYSPWFNRSGWQLQQTGFHCKLYWQQEIYKFELIEQASTTQIKSDSHPVEVSQINFNGPQLTAAINSHHYQAYAFYIDCIWHLFSNKRHDSFRLNAATTANSEQEANNSLHAPMPGTVTAILVKPGQTVKQGEKLMVLEAMKMEHAISAPRDGVVTEIFFKVGDLLNEGVQLLSLE